MASKDTRIFKFEYERGNPEYVNRQAAGGKLNGRWSKGGVSRILATNHEATSGWEDVTEELFGHARQLQEERKARQDAQRAAAMARHPVCQCDCGRTYRHYHNPGEN